jgi:hypothetical protein
MNNGRKFAKTCQLLKNLPPFHRKKISCPLCDTGGILSYFLKVSQHNWAEPQPRAGREGNRIFINVSLYNHLLTLNRAFYFYLPDVLPDMWLNSTQRVHRI